MKYMIVVLVLASVLSCKQENKTKEVNVEIAEPITETNVKLDQYPEPLLKVFEAHGGIANWKNKKNLVFKLGRSYTQLTFSLEKIG